MKQEKTGAPAALNRCLGLREALTITSGTVIGVGPVSYTHLDVYKRQLMLDAAWHGTKATVLGLGGSVVNTAAAVRHVQRGSFFLRN